MATNQKLEVTLSMIDKATAPLVAFSKRVEAIQAPLRAISNKLSLFGRAAGVERMAQQFASVKNAASGVASEIGRIAGALGLAGGGAIYAFKRGFVDVAAEFERFETILQTIEGSSDKAKESMNWISDFAARTPYELTEVTDAFVKLRAYGMEPTKGLLKTLGDTSAAMGKPLMQAVEAIADAVTGENERLKEFGIKARVEGKKIVYEYTHNGKTIRAAANRSNRAQIQATLEAIWNQKYAGSMDKLSSTWGGMMSNLGDQWTRFASLVMQSGPFESLKTRLQGLLAEVDEMADDGTLQRIAEEWGQKITAAIEGIYDAGVRLYSFVRRFVEFVGGWENAMIAVAAVMSGPLLSALVTLGAAVVKLGALMLTTPFGWFLAGAAALAGLAYVIYDSWDDITGALSAKWEAVKAAFKEGFIDGILEAWKQFDPTVLIMEAFNGLIKYLFGIDLAQIIGEKLRAVASALPSWAKSLLGIGTDGVSVSAQAQGYAAPVGAEAAARESVVTRNTTVTKTNNARVEVDFKNVPRGVTVTPDSRNDAPLNLHMGYSMVGAM